MPYATFSPLAARARPTWAAEMKSLNLLNNMPPSPPAWHNSYFNPSWRHRTGCKKSPRHVSKQHDDNLDAFLCKFYMIFYM